MKVEDLVGLRIRQAREEAGISQAELGWRMADYLTKAWAGQQVSEAEDGRRRIAARELFALSMTLGRPVSYFFVPLTDVELESQGEEQRSVPMAEARAVQTWGKAEDWNLVAPVVAARVEAIPAWLHVIEEATHDLRTRVEEIVETLQQGKGPVVGQTIEVPEKEGASS